MDLTPPPSHSPPPRRPFSSDLASDATTLTHPEVLIEGRRERARNRRRNEAGLLEDLLQLLPLPRAVKREMTKVDMLRMAACYVKLRGLMEEFSKPNSENLVCHRFGDQSTSAQVLLGHDWGWDSDITALLGDDGCLIIMTTEGEIVYLTETELFGHTEKFSLLGTSMYDLISKQDEVELADLLDPRRSKRGSASVYIRETRQPIRITGKHQRTQSGSRFFVSIANSVNADAHHSPGPHTFEFPFQQFHIHVTLGWAITLQGRAAWTDPRAPAVFGYSLSELSGISMYDLMYPEDMHIMRDYVQALGEAASVRGWEQSASESKPFRVLFKGGGWAWFITRAAPLQLQLQGDDGGGAGTGLQTVTYIVGKDFMVSEVYERGVLQASIQGPTPTAAAAGDVIQELQEPLEASTPAMVGHDYGSVDVWDEMETLLAN